MSESTYTVIIIDYLHEPNFLQNHYLQELFEQITGKNFNSYERIIDINFILK